jgi:hypothetical protein
MALVTLGLFALACLPAVVTFGLGWLQLPHIQPWGAPPARDTASPEAWTLFALFYLVWMAGLTFLLVWSFDRLGHHWQYYDRAPRPSRKERRRTRATMRAVAAEQQATIDAMRRREEREARRRRDRHVGGSDGGGR